MEDLEIRKIFAKTFSRILIDERKKRRNDISSDDLSHLVIMITGGTASSTINNKPSKHRMENKKFTKTKKKRDHQ